MTGVPFRHYEGDFSVTQLEPGAPLPAWFQDSSFYAAMKTRSELSVICETRCVPPGTKTDDGWSCLEVIGPMEFTVVGVMASLSGALAKAGISLMAVSTFDTDYLLVKQPNLEPAIRVLIKAGHIYQAATP